MIFSESKTVLILLVSLSTLMMITAGSVHIVLADPLHCDQPGWPNCYKIGYQDGLANPGTACPPNHSANFCAGWNAGALSGTTFPHSTAGQNWNAICNAIHSILVESCSQLVNPNGSLTQPDGQRAHDCIQNGILLGLGGIIMANGDLNSLPYIVGALNILSKLTGCDNVVVWNNLDLNQLTLLRHIFRI